MLIAFCFTEQFSRRPISQPTSINLSQRICITIMNVKNTMQTYFLFHSPSLASKEGHTFAKAFNSHYCETIGVFKIRCWEPNDNMSNELAKIMYCIVQLALSFIQTVQSFIFANNKKPLVLLRSIFSCNLFI